jgi:hypothetical protein
MGPGALYVMLISCLLGRLPPEEHAEPMHPKKLTARLHLMD